MLLATAHTKQARARQQGASMDAAATRRRTLPLIRFLLRFGLCSIAAVLCLPGCAADPAPEAITDVSRWVWRNYATATDARLADAVVALHGQVTAVTADEPLKVLAAELTQADVALAGRSGVDPAKARGMVVVTEFGCKLAQVKKIHTAPNQDELHPGAFATYKRTYAQGRDAFLAGQVAKLDWTSDITGDYGNGRLIDSARHVPDLGQVQTPFGAALVGRTWLQAAATGADWTQDYEVDIYYERTPGRVVHLVAAWRQATFSGFSTDSSFLQNIMMQSFVNWDKEIEQHCASGKF